MGVGIFPVFEPPVPGADFDGDGKLLVRESAKLDRIAISQGLKRLSAFGDNREVPEGFRGDPEELDEILGPWDEWFPVTEGLRTVEGLIRIIRSSSKTAAKLDDPVGVLEELEELARCLRMAKKEDSQFRLELV